MKKMRLGCVLLAGCMTVSLLAGCGMGSGDFSGIFSGDID